MSSASPGGSHSPSKLSELAVTVITIVSGVATVVSFLSDNPLLGTLLILATALGLGYILIIRTLPQSAKIAAGAAVILAIITTILGGYIYKYATIGSSNGQVLSASQPNSYGVEASQSLGPTQTPRIIEVTREIEVTRIVEQTPAPGPTQTPVVVVVTATPSTASTQADPSSSVAASTLDDSLRYRLDFGDETCVDLDIPHANKAGGADYEVCLSFNRFFAGQQYSTWADTQVVYIYDDQASYQGCANGTLIQGQVAHLGDMKQNQTICVSTSKGNWATLKRLTPDNKADITFDVTVFSP